MPNMELKDLDLRLYPKQLLKLKVGWKWAHFYLLATHEFASRCYQKIR